MLFAIVFFSYSLVLAHEEVNNLLVVYKNRKGRDRISAVLDFLAIDRSKILDVLYEIDYDDDDVVIDLDDFSPTEFISSIAVPNDWTEKIKDQLTQNKNIADVRMDPKRTVPPSDVDGKEVVTEITNLTDLPRKRNLGENTPLGIETVQASALWDIPSKEQIGICVVDTGYDLGHIDLPIDNVSGTNSTQFGPWFVDEHSHGTHCAGVIGAITNNGLGISSCMGNNNNFYFHVVKAMDSEGNGSGASIMAAIRGCAKAGTKIISVSLGGGSSVPAEADFYRRKFEEGFLIIAAAGNDGNTDMDYPASYGSVMSVTTFEDHSTAFQINNQVEISAPGVRVLSTVPGNGLQRKTGTSMATPHVSAVAALIWSRFPECTNLQIRNVLLMSAQPQVPKTRYGYGLVQAEAAYNLLKENGCGHGDTFVNPMLSYEGESVGNGGSAGVSEGDNSGACGYRGGSFGFIWLLLLSQLCYTSSNHAF